MQQNNTKAEIESYDETFNYKLLPGSLVAIQLTAWQRQCSAWHDLGIVVCYNDDEIITVLTSSRGYVRYHYTWCSQICVHNAG